MHSDQWRLRFHIAHHQRNRLFCAVALTVAGARILAAKSMDAELSPTGREVRRRHLLYRHAAHTSIIWDHRRVRVTRYCQEIVIWIDVRRTRKVRFLRFFFINLRLRTKILPKARTKCAASKVSYFQNRRCLEGVEELRAWHGPEVPRKQLPQIGGFPFTALPWPPLHGQEDNSQSRSGPRDAPNRRVWRARAHLRCRPARRARRVAARVRWGYIRRPDAAVSRANAHQPGGSDLGFLPRRAGGERYRSGCIASPWPGLSVDLPG